MIAQTLFQWLCDWLDKVEPRSDGNNKLISQMESDLLTFQEKLFAIKAILSWPLRVLVQQESMVQLVKAQGEYNEFTEKYISDLLLLSDEIRWRFGTPAQRAFEKLSIFIRNDVYHGAAYALNDIIKSINSFEKVLKNDDQAFQEAELNRTTRINTLEPVLKDLVRRSSSFIDLLK